MRALAIATVLTLIAALAAFVRAIVGGGFFSRFRRLAFAGIAGAFGIVLSALYVSLGLCLAFSQETLIAKVHTHKGSNKEFELRYEPVGEAARIAQPETVKLKGDQWMVSGAVVKWHPFFSLFGVRTYHRPLRISGQFASLEAQRSQPPTVYPIGSGQDKLWEAIYWVGPQLPFLEAVYGSAAYGFVDDQSVHEVYITPFGYLIKRVPRS